MERISVLVRVRPVNKQEALNGSPWKIAGNTISLHNQGPKFEFDRVFGEESKTVDIYEARTQDIVAAAVRGFNGTVFAYGQTSSGKTHTMRGSPTEPGVIPLAIQDVFKNIHETEDREFLLRMSYMEIYNEEINDLLVPEHRKLQIHESVERGIFVAGLREEIVATPEQVLQLIESGESHRHIGETNMNVYSSRSHTIFRMVIESRDKKEDDSVGLSCDAVRVSVLNLVDLAGSERVAKTGAEGARLKEGSHINKSLMTLGTVINKLSEGAETQRGHVPYRDSKLTRILQPALGGNAKTAIICNITPALIHVDETKGTLQFASRALRVTNCAQVNEVMTDAALLKRQKKEIEELRSKLQESHSEHLEEEILNLRNTLLQSELERERIALELQERERRLKEQEQRIENLSTMVLYSTMDERDKCVKTKSRRETWCPRAVLKEFTEEEFNQPSKGPLSDLVPERRNRDLPPPFQKLCEEQESNIQNFSKESGAALDQAFPIDNVDVSSSSVEYSFPDASAYVHVTGRKKKSSIESMSLNEMRDEILELQTRYQDLECEHENLRKIKNCETDDLKKRLAKAEAAANKQQKVNKLHHGLSTDRRGKSLTGWESESIMINKQLEDQVKTLELEKVFMQRDLDRLMEFAKGEKEQAERAFEELQQEFRVAEEESARHKEHLDSALATIQLLQKEKEEILDKIVPEFHDLRMEMESLKVTTDEVQSVAGDTIQVLSSATKLVQESQASFTKNIEEHKMIVSNNENVLASLKKKLEDVEAEKVAMVDQINDQQQMLEELKRALENAKVALEEREHVHNTERTQLMTEVSNLQKELAKLATSAVVREKESLRKDLEKMKLKLKDTESKLRNILQEKSKLEAEKANTDRETKLLREQTSLLQRGMYKRESLADKRRESKAFDLSKTKNQLGCVEPSLQSRTIESERATFDADVLRDKLAALENDLFVADEERETLAYELEVALEKMELTSLELNSLQEKHAALAEQFHEREAICKQLEDSVSAILKEKEELAMQVVDASLRLEEEKAVFSAREKSAVEAVKEEGDRMLRKVETEVNLLKEYLRKLKVELELSEDKCKQLTEQLSVAEEKMREQYSTSCLELAKLREDLNRSKAEHETSIDAMTSTTETLKSRAELLSLENEKVSRDIAALQNELDKVKGERDEINHNFVELGLKFENVGAEKMTALTQQAFLEEKYNEIHCKFISATKTVEALTERVMILEEQVQNGKLNFIKEKTKLEVRLAWTKAKLDAFGDRYLEEVEAKTQMHRRFVEDSRKLKEQLVAARLEYFDLKKQVMGIESVTATFTE